MERYCKMEILLNLDLSKITEGNDSFKRDMLLGRIIAKDANGNFFIINFK